MEFFIKPVPTAFVKLGDKSVKASSVLMVLEDIEENKEVKDYETDDTTASILVSEGILAKKSGSRMATLYYAGEKFSEFSREFRDKYYTYIENNPEID